MKMIRKFFNWFDRDKDKAIIKTFFIIYSIYFVICTLLYINFGLLSDFSKEYESMSYTIMTEENKSNIENLIARYGSGEIYNIEEGYDLSFNNQNIQITSRDNRFFVGTLKIEYSVIQNNGKPIISDCYSQVDYKFSSYKQYILLLCMSFLSSIITEIIVFVIFSALISIDDKI